MDSWLAAAVPLSAAAAGGGQPNSSSTTTTPSSTSSVEEQLAELCDLKKPPHHADQRDIVVRYADNGQYMHYARILAPMLGDISIGVSVPPWQRWRHWAKIFASRISCRFESHHHQPLEGIIHTHNTHKTERTTATGAPHFILPTWTHR